MMSDEELQMKMAQLDYLNQQIKIFQTQLLEVEKAIDELAVLKVGLQNILNANKGEEILIPLGASVYAFGELKNNKKVIVGIGAGVFVEKEIEKALPLVEKQMENLRKNEQILIENITLLSNEADKLALEINREIADRNVGLSEAQIS